IQKVLPDIILLDILMPGIDGFETCRRLKSLPLTQEIPVIFITALTDTDHIVKGLSLGAVDYLHKPLRREEVIARIKTQLKIRHLTQELQRRNQELQTQLEENQRQALAIRSSEEKFHIAFNYTPQPILICTPTQGNILEINDSFRQFLGLPKSEIIGKTDLELNLWRSLDVRQQILETLQTGDQVRNQEAEILNRAGEIATMLISAGQIRFNGIQACLLIFLDITERRRTEEQLQVLSQACEQSPASIVITNAEGNIDYVNPKFEQISGYSLAEVQGQNPRVLKSGHTSSQEYRKLWETLSAGQEWHGEFHNRKKNGELYWEKASISPIRNAQGQITHYVAVKEDITRQKEQEELLFYQANYDPVTGLPNRTLGQDRLKQALDHGQRHQHLVGVLFVDLDNFKKINDTLGHDTGDLLLKEVAQRLERAVRKSDTVARLGGDEFLIVVSKVKAPLDLATIAKRILGLLRQPFSLNSHELFINGSIGIAIFPEDGYAPEDLLKNADTAMYAAKADGRDTFKFFTAPMNAVAQTRLQLETELRQARKRREFSLLYQPCLDLQTGRVIGAEGLLRWRNQTLGEVSPEDFIPIAEETGQIIDVGEWIIEEACQQLALWQSRPSFRVLGLNISPRQLRDSYFLEMLESVLALHQINPQQLALEITENVLLDRHPDIIETLEQLGKLNIRLDLDDFGTGYSSLSYLHHFHFQCLKIDRSFVDKLPADPQTAALVKAMISLARHLEMEVIAEGVETQEQWDFLRENGCDCGQGYLFSPPVRAEELEILLDSQPFAL
ncbi:MAG: EAL domain-containing protein, partial [Cyanobacteriota bacterium]|nr:EAL domain-containing protein [Cyanobacteriota bacterium]